ncbi:phage/plasmid primase, P4 family [Thermodesulfobacteriota bacterium]
MDRDKEINIQKMVEARRAESAKAIDPPEPEKELASTFIRECLDANELGDGLIYAQLHDGQLIYNKSAAEWLAWAGHHWDRDIMEKALASAEFVAGEYLKEARRLVDQIGSLNGTNKDLVKSLESKQKQIYKRVFRIRTEAGRSNCLKFARTNPEHQLAAKGDEFDQNPFLLGCENGVIDLKNGELRPGRPDDFVLKASPVEWKGIDEPAPAWETALKEIFQDDQNLIEYVGRLFGYALTGMTTENILPIFWGQGRNGKTTIIETVSAVLGPLAAPIQSEMLLDQGRAKSSAGPSPDIMSLRGLRMAIAAETDQGRRFSTSKVKWLSGSDTLTGRYPHDKHPTEFNPTHTLFLLTNNKPAAPAHDFAFWERVHLVPFNLSFVERQPQAENERPADKNLKFKLTEEKFGILAWLVRGCLAWQEKGLNPPAIVREATQEYQRDEDLLADFIEECCYVDKKAEATAKNLYDRFSEWWEENISKRVPSQRKFGLLMTAKNFEKKKSPNFVYFGIGLISSFEQKI